MIVLVTIGLTSVTSCSPPIAGATGVSVDAEGHPIIVLAWCGEATPEGVDISHYEDNSGPWATMPGPSSAATVVDDVDFIAPSLDGQNASVRLDAPNDGWAVEPRPFVLRPGVLYSAFGYQGRGHNQVNTSHVTFSTDSMAALKPGLVLVQRYDDSRSLTGWGDVTITQEQFDRQSQDPANCQ
ncbi:hypothetical protein [Nonomuraea sp. NPDC049646]|uniref:hypothetical protein n=1 Tax=unclassified Nonomuraea TaxID=2593643 RepID=UPI0037A27D85